ncbi:Rv3654c family TadE-like protein [Leifsonia sp. fls2-241-R2A-40a]|uniref:Rv3654c family TadE-like protein n=1 Tax=Leifsonia sp. fls2-241-R2A-40a TaxID=3040290 RepID=UPI00254B7E9A|nr:Rv3654c family TadE-like protein [Leifsonia sp. fls2-241-R2A-40a]
MTGGVPFLRAVSADDRGSGSILALGILAAVTTVAAGGIVVVGAGAAHSRAAAAADLAALAAADVASGRDAGVPCETASAIAETNHAALSACEQQALVVTVTASVSYLGLAATASARAGPPGER